METQEETLQRLEDKIDAVYKSSEKSRKYLLTIVQFMSNKYKDPKKNKIKAVLADEAVHRYWGLITEIANPLKQCFEKTHHGSDTIIRAIIPIVDMFSSGNHSSRREILKRLGIIYPEIFWQSMRHGLIHNAKQSQCIKMSEIESGIIVSYNWDQDVVSDCVGGFYTINPKLLYEKTLEWLKECQLKPKDELVEYTYMLEVYDKKSELYKELKEEFRGRL